MKRSYIKRSTRRKKPEWREGVDPDYLTKIRLMKCLVAGCRIPSVAHHDIPRSRGGSDYQTVPLCWKHHDRLHFIGKTRFEGKTGLDITGKALEIREEMLKVEQKNNLTVKE